MSSQATARGEMARLAGLARIERSVMGAHGAVEDGAGARAIWSLGDYDRFAREMVWEFGPVLVSACGVAAGERLLDVACGTGNVALRAAAAGADVVGADITPEHFEHGRRAARELGVEVEWVHADAQALPFADASFDVVTSAAGAIFAPDHRAVAGELARVCRPDGTIAMINFTPGGTAGGFFELFARHAPPPPEGAEPPILWGDEGHVRELFGERVRELRLERRELVERHPGAPADYWGLYQQTFGPVVALRGLLAAEPERLEAFDRDCLAFVERENVGSPAGPTELRYGYAVVVARRAGG